MSGQGTDSEDQGGAGTARRARGLARMSEVYGFELGDLPGDFYGITVDHLFADIWTREGLADRDRRLLLIGMLAATGQHDVLGIQIPAAFASGDLAATELCEIVIFVSHYAGWSHGARLNSLVEETIARGG